MYSLVLVLFIIKNLNIHAYTIIYEYNNYIDTRRFFELLWLLTKLIPVRKKKNILVFPFLSCYLQQVILLQPSFFSIGALQWGQSRVLSNQENSIRNQTIIVPKLFIRALDHFVASKNVVQQPMAFTSDLIIPVAVSGNEYLLWDIRHFQRYSQKCT